MNVSPPPGSRAVFLSYASQDAEAVLRICEALRAAGIEVWFDQNELVGGDVWDAKIRGQIASCALFVPVISAATQARLEGYFRIEWKLAARRTHAMATAKAFLFPVVIDGTRDAEAHVPDEFREVQWTRLPGGAATEKFCARVKRLLDGEIGAVGAAAIPVPAQPTPVRSRRRVPVAAWISAVVVALAAVGYVALRPTPNSGAGPALSRSKETPPLAPEKPAATTTDAKSIAVLPFEDVSASAEGATFTAGMHFEMLTALQKVGALRIIGRTSVLPYADPKKRNLREIAATLGVGSVVEGSVQRIGHQVRISVQLSETQTSRQIWAETYTRDFTEWFAIESAIAQEVAGQLNATLTAQDRISLDRRPTRDPRAYELFLLGKLLANDLIAHSPKEEWEAAARSLEEAVAADPEFVSAWAALVALYAQMYFFVPVDATPARYDRARWALAALERIAPGSPEAVRAHGRFLDACDRNNAEALRYYEIALSGSGNDSQLLGHVGFARFQTGRYADGVEATRRAQALDPLFLQHAVDLLHVLPMLRRYSEAAELGNRTKTNSPESAFLVGRLTSLARYEIDGDRSELVRRWRALPVRRHDPGGQMSAYEIAMITGDVAAAANAIGDRRLDGTMPASTDGGPVALHRALVARLRDDSVAARAQASEAAAWLRAATPSPRERPYYALLQARADGYGGDTAGAMRQAATLAATIGDIGTYDRAAITNELGRLYALLGAREEALACLRTLMTGPTACRSSGVCFPRSARLDPCWSRLADDPRFEEILKAATPL